MADGTNTTTSWDNVIPTILSRARDAIEKPRLMTNKNVVTVVTLKDGDGTTYNWPKFEELLTADTLTEGEPIARRQRMIPSSHQFTTNEVGVSVIMTDKAVRVTPEAMRARAGRFMGNAMKRRQENDMLDLFSGLSRDLGTAGNPFSPGWISAAANRLEAASESGQSEPLEGKPIAVLQAYHYHDILTSAATLGSNVADGTNGYYPIEGITEQLVRDYDIKQLYGATLAREGGHIDIDSDDDAVSAMFGKSAFIHVKTSHSMRMEKDRDIELRANLLVMTSEYGVGELEDQHGFKFTADASVPTS